jgi:chemotaxis methyl-accepting protein methylase
MHDSQFRQLLDHFNYSWAGFRKVRKGVKKRLARHMQTVNCRGVNAYITAIEKNDTIRQNFKYCMTVSISRFFRDRELWEILQNRILPLLFQTSSQTLQIWFAGCAAGEEVYSFKILWEQFQNSHAQKPKLHILATDLNPAYLSRAQTAIYPTSSLREVPENIQKQNFKKFSRGRYGLKSYLKKGIEWQVHDLFSELPATRFQLIFLRNNLLTYYDDCIKIPTLKLVTQSLFPGGFLIIGNHEKPPIENKDLKQFDESPFIFQSQVPI